MSDPIPQARAGLRAITQARLTHGPRGRALDTGSRLQFALDFARARDAVGSEFDLPRVAAELERAGLSHHTVVSAAGSRDTFLRRPDLGQVLPPEAAATIRAYGPTDVALVLGDGLSAIAAMLNGPAFLTALTARLIARGVTVGPVVLAQQARVALGDAIARNLQAKTVVVALGERPGLSAADGLGVYITHAPQAKTADSGRNCISNIREAGLSVAEAARQAERLIVAMHRTGQSGVALSQQLASEEAGRLQSRDQGQGRQTES